MLYIIFRTVFLTIVIPEIAVILSGVALAGLICGWVGVAIMSGLMALIVVQSACILYQDHRKYRR